MIKHSIHLIFTAFILTLLCSCATILNQKKASVTVLTNTPTRLVIGNDTVKNMSTSKSLWVDRSNEPLLISVYNDSLTKNIDIKAKNSFAYWLNLQYGWWFFLGSYIDTKTKKRYTYPQTVYIDLSTKSNSYSPYNPLHDKYVNILKFTPLKIIGMANSSVEFSYERKTGRSFSTQIMASYLLPINVIDLANNYNPNTKGFRVALEEKFYFRKSAPLGPYLSFEFDYLNNLYHDIDYFRPKKDIYSETAYDSKSYSDTIQIKKQLYNFNLKIGYQIFVNRLSFDFYAGLGLRYKNTKHLDRINPEDEMSRPRHPNFYYMTNVEGKYLTLSIPLNVRIGWLF